MTDAGRLTIVGRSPDGLIEAVADPSHAFRLGVQWHPERTPSGPLGLDLVEHFIAACRNVR
jgi:putative glutamine amidotransferase